MCISHLWNFAVDFEISWFSKTVSRYRTNYVYIIPATKRPRIIIYSNNSWWRIKIYYSIVGNSRASYLHGISKGATTSYWFSEGGYSNINRIFSYDISVVWYRWNSNSCCIALVLDSQGERITTKPCWWGSNTRKLRLEFEIIGSNFCVISWIYSERCWKTLGCYEGKTCLSTRSCIIESVTN